MSNPNGHGPSGHGGHGVQMAWVEQHMGGLVLSYGKRFEALTEQFMFFIVNKTLFRLFIVLLAIMAPVILIEFVMHTL